MKKNVFVLLTVLVLTGLILSACGAPATSAPAAQEPETKPMKIAFFVSDLSNVFHQGQAAEAKKYAKEKYGAEVFVFDGKADSAVMTQNVDQIMAQGMDAATLHIWDYDAVRPAVLEAIDKGVILTSFFSPLGDSGIPTARSDEAGISFAMGVEMAKQWKAAHPDKPIVMVELGWPNHTEVKSGRTDPWVKGVLSVDPKATDLGCLDVSKGTDQAKQVMTDLLTTHPEVNLIYSEASGQTVGTMAALVQAGRGKMDNGKPLTEIVSSVDFDEVEFKQVYDPNSSLKLSMGLPPLETSHGRIDLIMDIKAGKVKPTSQPAEEFFYKAYNISFWTMPKNDAAEWLNTQFGTNVEVEAATAPKTEGLKIAFFVSDLSNVFHQAQAAEAQKYAKEKYGAEVFVFDGKADSAVMTQNVDQIMAQGMDAATLHIWDYDAVRPAVLEALDKGIVLTSFFSPLGDSGIPTARSDEAGISFAMGAEMAKQWKAAHPDKPIVMVELGWPNHVEVKSGRTDPWVEGVLSVDPKATDLGCLDVSKGTDQAKQVMTDLLTTHPEVNLIYSEASGQTVGTMAALLQAGRGKFDNGKPLTEIVSSVDFDEVEMKQVYDPNSSLKLSMGLPPIETSHGRIDLIMDVLNGKVKPTTQPAEEFFYKAYNVSFWTMPEADAVEWLNTQFGTNLE